MKTMYIEDGPISASKLSEKSGSGTSWIVGGSSFGNLAVDNKVHESIDKIPSTPSSIECIDIAHKMINTLKGARLPASESDTIGKIVVITNGTIVGGSSGRPPSIKMCVNALGLKGNVDGWDLLAESTIDTTKDWSNYITTGFCFEEEDVDDNDDINSNQRKVIATTKIMASELTDHFEYNMSDNIVCAPVLYGGRVKGSSNSFIAVLSMRVWT